jgi:hypothetical protein
MLVTWVVTVWLFERFGGDNAGWLGWGMGEEFAPRVEGLYFVAALIAAGWGILWLSAPTVVAVYRAIKSDAAPVAQLDHQ